MSEQNNNYVRPVLKWAGGKRQLLPELISRRPATYGRYFEPMVGAGALFLALAPQDGVICDANLELINLYRVIKAQPQKLIREVKKYQNDEAFYYQLRDADRTAEYVKLSAVKKAARILYLNRTCFNGLYRVNSAGQFNVPFGKYSNPTICDQAVINNLSAALQTTTILSGSFQKIISYLQTDDFVYFDPPYIPINSTANFTSYTQEAFGGNLQVELRNFCRILNKLGIKFMLSNSDTALSEELYSEFKIDRVNAKRSISSNAQTRDDVSEIIVTNY